MNASIDIDTMKVLLIDDDATFRFIVKTITSKTGIADVVYEAVNGQEALGYLRSNSLEGKEQPDMIFLDINMPVMNGWDFLNELSSLGDSYLKCLPVFIVTSSINTHDREKSHTYPSVKGMFPKPLTSKHLEEMRALMDAI